MDPRGGRAPIRAAHLALVAAALICVGATDTAMRDARMIKRIRKELGSSDAEMRGECVEALIALGDIRGLLRASRSRDTYVRARAVRALGKVPGGRITWRLSRLRHDPEADVRCAVAQALARRRGWFVARILAQLAGDEHAVVRYTSVTRLAQIDWSRAEPLLQAIMTGDAEGWVRDAAAALLRRHDRDLRDSGNRRGTR